MRLYLLGLAAGVLYAASGVFQTAQAAVERQESFRDWHSECQTDKSCLIQTHVPGGASAGGAKFRLRVSRKRPNGDFSISIAAPGIQVNAKNPLSIQVDQSSSVSLEPDVGFVALDADNTFFVARRDVTLAMILAMRSGGKLIAKVPKASGGSETVNFSLSGFSKAFEFIGGPAANVPSAELIAQSGGQKPQAAAPAPAPAQQAAPTPAPVIPPVASAPPPSGPQNPNASAPLFPTLQTQPAPATNTTQAQPVGPAASNLPAPRAAPREVEPSQNAAASQEPLVESPAAQSQGYELLPPPPGTFDPSAPPSELASADPQPPASPLFGGAMTSGSGAAGPRGATLSSQTQTSAPSLLPSAPTSTAPAGAPVTQAGTPVTNASSGTQVSALLGGAVQPGTIVSPPLAAAPTIPGIGTPGGTELLPGAEGPEGASAGTNNDASGSLISAPSSVSSLPSVQETSGPPVVTNVPRSQSITGGEVIAAAPAPPPSAPAASASPLLGGAVDPNAPPAAAASANETFDVASVATSATQPAQTGPTSLIAAPAQTTSPAAPPAATPSVLAPQQTNAAVLAPPPATTAAPVQPAAVPSAAAPASSWPDSIVPHLSTIKRCFGRIPDPPGRVTTSWAFENGVVGVVARGGDDSKWVCLSLPDDPDFVMIRRAGNEESLPAEGPSFRLISPDPGTPLCKKHKEVFDEVGTSVGWLTYDDC